MIVAVTGAHGMLGSDVCTVLGEHREILPFDIDDFDIADEISTQKHLSQTNPDLIIHCAAYADVDRAEQKRDEAFRINSIGTKNVATVSQRFDIPMVYISTDYVFDGEKSSPYLEGDSPNPINVYGKSKLEGEKWVKALLSKFYIVRTSWLYGKNGENFVYKILKVSNLPQYSTRRNQLAVVDDQVGSPTYTLDVAKALDCLIQTEYYGVYHITNTGFCSWYRFAQKIFEILGKEVSLKAVNSSCFRQAAIRPKYSVLDNPAWSRTFGIELRPWQDALKDFLSSFQQE